MQSFGTHYLPSYWEHLENHNIVTDFQHGFRKRRNCETQLIVTFHDLVSAVNRGSQVDAFILDFSKPFDRVPHERLLYKLSHYGINGSLLTWIRAFLTQRTQKVTLEGIASNQCAVTSGVPQGTVLEPLLFLIYISMTYSHNRDFCSKMSLKVREYKLWLKYLRELSWSYSREYRTGVAEEWPRHELDWSGLQSTTPPAKFNKPTKFFHWGKRMYFIREKRGKWTRQCKAKTKYAGRSVTSIWRKLLFCFVSEMWKDIRPGLGWSFHHAVVELRWVKIRH